MHTALGSDRLSLSVVERVRSQLIAYALYGDWYDYVYELWKTALAQIGFGEVDISFSGFSSQGDGASFTAPLLDIGLLMDFFTTKITPKNCIEPTGRLGEEEDFWPYLTATLGADACYFPQFASLRPYAAEWAGAVVRVDRHYVHAHTCETELTDWPEELMAPAGVVAAFRAAVEQVRVSLCLAIYKSLEDEHDSLVTEDALVERDANNARAWDVRGRQE